MASKGEAEMEGKGEPETVAETGDSETPSAPAPAGSTTATTTEAPPTTPNEATTPAVATDAAAAGAAETPSAEENPSATGSSETDKERTRRVYVGNLSWGVSWQTLKDHVKAEGLDVTHAHIMTTPDGRSKGCGIVEFATPEDAQKAVETLNDTELEGRQIFVREDREAGAGGRHSFSTGEQAKNRRVYVGNLSWDVAWQDLKDHMRQAGEVVHAEVITEHSGRSKGCGIVEFATEEEAQEAIRTLTDTDLKGRMIFVREDRESSSQAGGTPPKTHNTSVYVWNLSPETSWQDLKDHMRKAGNVDTATILTNSKGESIGCGIAVYQRPQEAARAIRELQNSELHGSPIYIREDRAQPGRGGGGGRGYRRSHGRGGSAPEGTQLYVGNLSFQTSWRELKDHFRQCGEVKRAEVKLMPNGQSKGFGFVQFLNKAEAEEAIKRLNGSELQGRELEVRLDQKNRY